MDLDTILEDVQEGRESDVGIKAMDVLLSLKDGLDKVLNKIAELEGKQMNLQSEINVIKNDISGEIASETHSKKKLNGHGDVTDELPNTYASDDKTDVNADVNSVDEQTFVPTDNTDKVFEFGFVVRVKSYDFGA